ncbi:MAG: hypothetical protein AABZ47_07390 [Planctomycetota bacterium]
MKKTKKWRESEDKALQRIWHEYEHEFGTPINDPEDVARWAIETKRFEKTVPSLQAICKRALTRAIRNEYVTDAKDRTVRSMCAVPKSVGGQLVWEWGRLYSIPPDGVRISLQRRRNQAVSECRQIRNDNESYNDYNEFGAQIPLLDFNIQRDLEEERLALDDQS